MFGAKNIILFDIIFTYNMFVQFFFFFKKKKLLCYLTYKFDTISKYNLIITSILSNVKAFIFCLYNIQLIFIIKFDVV